MMMKVLVVEDEPMVRSLCQAILKNFGYEVTVADGREQAISLLHPEHFPEGVDLVVTDLNCPGRNSGLEVLRAADELAKELGVGLPGKLLMSGESVGLASKAKLVGAGCLIKPFTPISLQTVAVEAIHAAAIENTKLAKEAGP